MVKKVVFSERGGMLRSQSLELDVTGLPELREKTIESIRLMGTVVESKVAKAVRSCENIATYGSRIGTLLNRLSAGKELHHG
jgi:hypothetical protein